MKPAVQMPLSILVIARSSTSCRAN